MKAKLIAMALLSLAFNLAHAGGSVSGATEPTQLMNNTQLVMSYGEQAQQTATQLRQYQTMLTNLKQMTPSAELDQAAQKLWQAQHMTETFSNLRQMVIGGQRVAYAQANLDARFKQLHPGYGGYGSAYDYATAYRNWSDNTHNSVKNSLSLMSAHADEFATERDLVSTLQNRTATAEGQLQAVQAGNQISMAMVGQMQKLRQLQMAQMQTQSAYMGAEQSRRDSSDAQMQQYIDNARRFKTEKSTGRVIFK